MADDSPSLSRSEAEYPLIPAASLQDAYSKELRHYFAHYLYRSVPRPALPPTPAPSVSPPGAGSKSGDASTSTAGAGGEADWTESFTLLRLSLAPTSAELCASGFYILHIPRTPWLLVSGAPGRGSENRTIALAAFATAAGARSVTLSLPPAQFERAALATAAALDEADESIDGGAAAPPQQGRRQRPIAELKGRDPLSLRDILTRAGAPEGGAGLEMVRGYVEDGPLVEAVRRRREVEAVTVYGGAHSASATPPPPEEEALARAQARMRAAQDAGAATTYLLDRTRKLPAQEVERRAFKRRREAREMFGAVEDAELPVVPRMDFEVRGSVASRLLEPVRSDCGRTGADPSSCSSSSSLSFPALMRCSARNSSACRSRACTATLARR